jgi:hypothetical protein
MPPEQARGQKLLTTAADVYALGAILYELLTGRPPFRADTPLDTLLEVLDREPAPPREIEAKADLELSAVALKCLDKDPGRRYESAAALAEELEHWLAGEPVRARRTGRLRRRLRWLSQHPTMHGLWVLTMVMLFWSVGMAWMWGSIPASAAVQIVVMASFFGLLFLFGMPNTVSARLAVEERRRGPQPSRAAIAPVQAEQQSPPATRAEGITAPSPSTDSELRLSLLATIGRGAAEGLLVGCLLLVIPFVANRFVYHQNVAPYPDPGWCCSFLFSAALMTALARVLGRPLGSRPRCGSRVKLNLGFYSFGAAGIVLLLGNSEEYFFWFYRLLVWIQLALAVVAVGLTLLGLLVAERKEHGNSIHTWSYHLRLLSMPALFFPEIGFLLGELVARLAPSTTVTAPLTGAMIGWAIGLELHDVQAGLTGPGDPRIVHADGVSEKPS